MDSYYEKILNELEIETKKDEVLYHYTNTDALLSIINKKELWISHVKFMNDYLELTYINEILNKLLDKRKGLISWLKEIFSQKGVIYKDIGELVLSTMNNFIESSDIYVLSMSEDPDSLSVWSNYSKEEGYNIGFCQKEFLSILDNQSIDYVHGKVIYDDVKQEESIENYVGLCENYFTLGLSPDSEKEKFTPIACIALSSIFFKKNCFSNENEYRFVFFQNKNANKKVPVEFRNLNNSIIPYIKLPIETKESLIPLSTITIGPKNNLDIAKTGLTYFLINHHYENVNEIVKKSDIPLRY